VLPTCDVFVLWLGRPAQYPRQRSPQWGPIAAVALPQVSGVFLETHGTPLHGKHVAPERLMWAVCTLAEGLGLRAVARVIEADPNTVLSWLVEAAPHAAALSQYSLRTVQPCVAGGLLPGHAPPH
jgi:hypothetical protein